MKLFNRMAPKSIFIVERNPEKYGVSADFFLDLITNFFNDTSACKDGDDLISCLSSRFTKKLLSNFDSDRLWDVDFQEHEHYLTLTVKSPCKAIVETRHVSRDGFDVSIVLKKNKDLWVFSEFEFVEAVREVTVEGIQADVREFHLRFPLPDRSMGLVQLFLNDTKCNGLGRWHAVMEHNSMDRMDDSCSIFSHYMIRHFSMEPEVQDDMYGLKYFHYWLDDNQMKNFLASNDGYVGYSNGDRKYSVKL